MNYVKIKDKEVVKNNSVVREEERGTARELMQGRLTTLTDNVRNEIQKLSVLEVIG